MTTKLDYFGEADKADLARGMQSTNALYNQAALGQRSADLYGQNLMGGATNMANLAIGRGITNANYTGQQNSLIGNALSSAITPLAQAAYQKFANGQPLSPIEQHALQRVDDYARAQNMDANTPGSNGYYMSQWQKIYGPDTYNVGNAVPVSQPTVDWAGSGYGPDIADSGWGNAPAVSGNSDWLGYFNDGSGADFSLF
jgi:hypothetical protein